MPRTLILMRHAEAGIGYPDHKRPLSSAGIQDAAAAGTWIRQALPGVDAVVCSTAKRTRQTLEATAIDAPARFADGLYGGNAQDILDEIALTPGSAQTVLVVGHAPGIPAVAYELAMVARINQDGPNQTAADDSNKDEPDIPPDLAALRHFSACAIAVLQIDGSWNELADVGGELLTVRHPRD
jgi:phosphohistidine phosphatase